MRTSSLLVCAALAACAHSQPMTPAEMASSQAAANLDSQTARFAPTELKLDLSALPAGERAALAELVRAARVMDSIFLRQVWAGNQSLLVELAADRTALGRARLHALLVNKGPWSRLDQEAPFLSWVGPKPHGAGFYPSDATKEEIERWAAELPEKERARAMGFFTTVRRDARGGLVAVNYSLEYQDELSLAAQHLRKAAELTSQPTLKTFLTTRAQAFASNDYYESDVAWMELDSSIEPTIGPYEVYEDGWFNAKAAFEAFIGLRDDAETQKLQRLSSQLQGLEDALPIEAALRNPKLGALAPIRVVNQIFCAGDANRGVQTAAYNLPNDERITREKGAKRVMLRNVQQAKFDQVLVPIAQVALAEADRKDVAFDAFFTHILMHELMHGLGPHRVTGKEQTVRQAMQEAGSALEEAKADISGLWALQQLVDKGVLDKGLERTMYTTFLASAFRSIRFGLTEAHAKGIALQLNTLLDAGAFKVAGDGTFAVDAAKVKGAVAALTKELMELQASGDAARARQLLTERAVLRPDVKRVLDRLAGVPVDIEPRFTTAEQLTQEGQR
jgi:hypothetical protein